MDLYQWAWKILGLYFTKQHDRALESIEEAKNLHDIFIDQSGSFALTMRSAMVYSYLGMCEEALSTLEEHNIEYATILSIKAIACHNLGRAEKSRRLIEEIKTNYGSSNRQNPSHSLAAIYAQMGEVDTAFKWLEKAY